MERLPFIPLTTKTMNYMSKEEALISGTREKGFKEGVEYAFDCILSKLEQKLDTVLEAETTESLIDWIVERKIKLTNKNHE